MSTNYSHKTNYPFDFGPRSEPWYDRVIGYLIFGIDLIGPLVPIDPSLLVHPFPPVKPIRWVIKNCCSSQRYYKSNGDPSLSSNNMSPSWHVGPSPPYETWLVNCGIGPIMQQNGNWAINRFWGILLIFAHWLSIQCSPRTLMKTCLLKIFLVNK